MRTLLALLLFPSLALAQIPLTPAGAVGLASADSIKLGSSAAYSTRYLSVYNLRGGKQKRLAYEVLSAHINRLSRSPLIVPPVLILEDGSARLWPAVAEEDWERLALIRLNVFDYGWKRETYGRLSVQENFFHVRITKGKDRSTALAPWLSDTLPERTALDILVRNCQSQVPVLRADNFFFQTAFQFGQEVGYYGLQEINDQKDFDRLVGFNRKEVAEFSPGFLAAVANSGVSIKPRRIEVQDKIGGLRFATFDNDIALDQRNPLRVLDEKNFQFKATEVFAHGANGLWKVLLANDKGLRQDSAPDFVGHDKTTTSNDGRIHIGISCFRCHTDAGLQGINDWARNLFRPPLQLSSPDYQVLYDLKNAYFRRLEPKLAEGRIRYAAALVECNGLAPEKDARQMAIFWQQYVDTPVTLEQAELETGTPAAEIVKRLAAYTKASGNFDTVLGMYLRPRAEQEAIPREQFDEAFPILQAALRGVQLP